MPWAVVALVVALAVPGDRQPKKTAQGTEENRPEQLSVERARQLVAEAGREAVKVNDVTTLSDEAAKALAQHKGGLHLNGLTTLSVEAAQALAQHPEGHLSLDGLTTLSAEAAKALAQHEGKL